jgi:hypothetical protein
MPNQPTLVIVDASIFSQLSGKQALILLDQIKKLVDKNLIIFSIVFTRDDLQFNKMPETRLETKSKIIHWRNKNCPSLRGKFGDTTVIVNLFPEKLAKTKQLFNNLAIDNYCADRFFHLKQQQAKVTSRDYTEDLYSSIIVPG